MKRQAIVLAAALVSACQCDSEGRADTEAKPRPSAAAKRAEATGSAAGPDRIPAPDRIVAIGDLHGDLNAARRALKLAGAIDDDNEWIGGKLTVVQTGDQIDRGDDEPQVVALFDSLEEKAKAKGGAVVSLNGNHEVMNVQGDFRYVTQEGFSDFDSYARSAPDPVAARVPPSARGRAAAFLPGGPIARTLAERPVTAIVGDTLFVHGGVLPQHVQEGLKRANEQTSAWMRGDVPSLPAVMQGDNAPIWTRAYGDPSVALPNCDALGKVLESLKVMRLVVGHTVMRDGISPACNDRVWRIDVGLAKHYGGPMQVLEIQGGSVRPLSETDH